MNSALETFLLSVFVAVCVVVFSMFVGLFLTGCGANLPGGAYRLNQDDVDLVDELSLAWVEAGLPEPGEMCSREVAHLRVAVLEGEEFTYQCKRCEPGNCPGYRVSEDCPWGCASECFTNYCYGSWPSCWGDGNSFLGGAHIPMVVVHEQRFEEESLDLFFIHGLGHLMAYCTGLHPDGDTLHRDALLWETVRSVQQRHR